MTLRHAPTIRLLAVLLVLLVTAGCDQATKHLARSQLSQVSSATLPGGFVELTLTQNPGAFLSLGASLPEAVRAGIFTVGLTVGLTFLLVYLVRASRLNPLSFFGLVLAWAGGMSNLIDRFAHHGLVTDFILIRAGPLHTGVFNIADLAIVVGTIILALSIRGRKRACEFDTILNE